MQRARCIAAHSNFVVGFNMLINELMSTTLLVPSPADRLVTAAVIDFAKSLGDVSEADMEIITTKGRAQGPKRAGLSNRYKAELA